MELRIKEGRTWFWKHLERISREENFGSGPPASLSRLLQPKNKLLISLYIHICTDFP